MAGLGFKDFTVGEVLTSADVDGYLMQQTVMRFADAGARGSALGTAVGTAVALAEGMVSYLDDVNDVQVFTGAGWASVIGIRQVVSTARLAAQTSTATSFTDLTGLTVTITPSVASSQVLIIAQVSASVSSTNGHAAYLKLAGGNAGTYDGDAAGSRIETVIALRGDGTFNVGNYTPGHSLVYLDSPNTTSAVTYSVQGRVAGGGTLYVNRSQTDTDNDTYGRGASSITVMEIAA